MTPLSHVVNLQKLLTLNVIFNLGGKSMNSHILEFQDINKTKLIKDGQRVRVSGTDRFVEILK